MKRQDKSTGKHIFKSNIFQIIKSPWFYISILCVVILSYMSIWDWFYQTIIYNYRMTVQEYVDMVLGYSSFKHLLILIAAIPYTASFTSDWKYQYIRTVVVRSGLKKYVFSKILTAFLTSLMVVFIGIVIFIISLYVLGSPLFYMDKPVEEYLGAPFKSLAEGNLPILYIMAKLLVLALAVALWNVVGMAVSAYIPNRFVAIASPIIACYIIEEISLILPPWLDVYHITRSHDVLQQSAGITFAYMCFFFVALSCVPGAIFYRQVKRRVRNEVV